MGSLEGHSQESGPAPFPFRSHPEMREMLERALSGERRTGPRPELEAVLRRAGIDRQLDEGPLWLHEFRFAATPDAVPGARRRVAEFAADCGLGGEALYDMALAAAEALSNAVLHGSPNGVRDDVEVRVGVGRRTVVVEIRDRGPGFEPGVAAAWDGTATGGRGIPFMRGLLDEVRFGRLEVGTCVVLTKRVG